MPRPSLLSMETDGLEQERQATLYTVRTGSGRIFELTITDDGATVSEPALELRETFRNGIEARAFIRGFDRAMMVRENERDDA